MRYLKFLFLAAVLTFALAACGAGGEATVTPPPAGGGEQQPPTGNDAPHTVELGPPERDLGGSNFRIVTWWTEGCTETADPDSASMRARWDDRAEMEQRYNFRMHYYRFGSWGDVRDNVQPEILAGNRDYHIWIVEPTWFATHHGQRLFAPIPMRYFEDDFGINWVNSVIELTMRDGSPHGFASGGEFAGGIYFNQRLFEEAGLAYDLPFTLQREGNWTWDTFMDAARRLSRDIDGDGIIDTWALTTFATDLLNRAVVSNGAAYAQIDPDTGEFVNSTNTDAFLEAVDFAAQLRREMLAFIQGDVGGEWDAFVQMFNDGHGAMRSAGHYVAANIQLEDPWGFVAFPRGPRAQNHYDWIARNINVIPHFFSEEEVSDIMFAMQMWIRPIPDDDPDDWIFANLVNHPDVRSVEETMRYFTRPPEFQLLPAHQMMPGLGHTLGEVFQWRIWGGEEAAVIVEEGQLVWGDFINRVNAL